MEIYTTKDNSVLKYIHDDGSETAIKTIPGCVEFDNPLTKQKQQLTDKNKYVVFISSSVGCSVGCKFCYLTSKKFPHINLSATSIIDNTLNSIKHSVTINPKLKEKYIKLSFMGMGDAFFILEKLPYIIKQILNNVVKNNWAKGLDGIDIGTVFPHKLNDYNKNRLVEQIKDIRTVVSNRYHRNIWSLFDRSTIRIFYSLHSFDRITRNSIIPLNKRSLPLSDVLFLKDICDYLDVDLIFHQMFLKDINDHYFDIYSFINIFTTYFHDHELRVLLFNECENSKYKRPSKKQMKEILTWLNKNINYLKVQHSAGSEIKASCGQFIMKDIKCSRP